MHQKDTINLIGKKTALLLSLVVVLLISCTGDPGPIGPPGFDGIDGADGLIGTIFEVEVDFTSDNDYEFIVDFPTDIEVFDTDIVMAYILSGVDNDVDIWEPLPQTLFLDSGILLYGYDYTFSDINFFLDGTVDLASLDPLLTDGIIYRVAIIPADFAKNIDLSNIKEVMGAMRIDTVKRM